VREVAAIQALEPIEPGPGDPPRARLRRLKGFLVAATLASFGGLLGLAASHATGVTSRASSAGGGPPTGKGAAGGRPLFGGGGSDGGNSATDGFGFGPAGSSSPAASSTFS